MTFGEKLYQLRKSHGFSQETLAEKLNTSRQAISKWENNNGYPETEKIILISKLFQVNLDDLLIEEKEINAHKEAGAADEADEFQRKSSARERQGYYVNRETANGFLLYYKRKFLFLAAACGMIVGCNGAYYGSIEPTFYELVVQPILTTVSGVMMLLVVIYIVLKQNPYRTLRKKDLVFANDVRKEIEEEFSKMKKVLIIGIAICLVIFGISEGIGENGIDWETLYLMSDAELIRQNISYMILVGVCCFGIVFCTGVYWSYAVLLRNNVVQEEK